MKDLHQFLGESLIQHQQRMRDLRQLAQSVAHTLLNSRGLGRWFWPYSCSVKDDKLQPLYSNALPKQGSESSTADASEQTVEKKAAKPENLENEKPSISTQAMICASIDRIILRAYDHEILSEDAKSQLQNAQHQVEIQVLKQLQQESKKKPFLQSSTFGEDDVFTASWLLRMYSDQKQWNREEKDKWWTDDVKRRLVEIVATRIKRPETEVIDYDRGLFEFESRENEAGPHSLPLLKVIQALEIIKADDSLAKHWLAHFREPDVSVKDAIRLAGEWLEKNLHRQMSFYRFKDFRFDAAELIFCLHGSISTGRITAYESIIDNVLDAIRDAQNHSVYWRPYRPMTSSSQGGVLLPLSIEVAVALLKTLQVTKKFMKYADTLEEYSKWLYSQRLIPSDAIEGQAPDWVGWHSENAYEGKVIHVWDTALVGAFLCDLLEAKDVNFQKQVLEAGSFTFEDVTEIDRDIPPLEKMVPPDAGLRPSDTKTKLLREYVTQDGLRPEKFSLLIYGPPGSSKTTLAKALAKSLGWGMVYLSPTNFITSGEAGIEQQAKDIFDALGVLRDKVIFFDEIDRLILDRDSNAYGEQGDMFQFMTPSMLTKINDLRRAKRCIFIIATNYEEHIDRAIKRKGRIDESIPWLPMDFQSRTELFQTFIDNAFGKMDAPWPDYLTKELQKFTKKRTLQIYPELKECFKNASKKVVKNGKSLEKFRTELVDHLNALVAGEIPAGEVSLDSYKRRTTKTSGPEPDDYVQRAYLEYAFLLVLKGETAEDGDAEKDFKDLLKRWEEQDPEDYQKRQPDVRKRVKAYGLKWMN